MIDFTDMLKDNEVPSKDEGTPDLPVGETSKRQYKQAYKKFTVWCCTQNIAVETTIDEETLIRYFSTAFADKAASTTFGQYGMLKVTLKAYNNIDISSYKNLIALAKKGNAEPKKFNTLTKDQVYTFLTSASNDKYLDVKAVLIAGIFGALRLEELKSLTVSDVIEVGETCFKLMVTDSKSKKKREVFIFGEVPVEIFRRYMALRVEHTKIDQLFLYCSQGKLTPKVIGHNRFGTFPSRIATYLDLPDIPNFGGHCFYYSSAPFLAAHASTAQAKPEQPNKNDEISMKVEEIKVEDRKPKKIAVKALPVTEYRKQLPMEESDEDSASDPFQSDNEKPPTIFNFNVPADTPFELHNLRHCTINIYTPRADSVRGYQGVEK